MSSVSRQPCRFHKLWDNRGSIHVLVAVMLPVILGVGGLALDVGNLYLAHNRLQTAVDAAALAGSLELPYDKDLDKGIVTAAVQQMLSANDSEALLVSAGAGTEVRSVCVKAQSEVNTLLLGVLGITSSTVEAEACAGFNHLEVVFVIDNSGSMRGTPINNTNQACIDLVDLIIPDGATGADTKVGLVPFRGKVRIPAGVDGVAAGCRNADGSLNEGLNDEFMDEYWALPYYQRSQVSLETCTNIPWTQALTANKYSIINAVATQDGGGAGSGTLIGEGIKWGMHVLTPEAPFTEGSDEDEIRKIMIVLTDGDTEDGQCGGTYQMYYNPNSYWTNAVYGMGITDHHCQDGGGLNQDMLDAAAAAKAADIEIFSIRFGSSDWVDINLMRQIASSKPGTNDHYFDAPSAEDIPEIFKKIGRQLGWRLLN